MAVKQFPADYADITAQADKLLGSNADGTLGFIQLMNLFINTSQDVIAKSFITKKAGPGTVIFMDIASGGTGSLKVFKDANESINMQIFKADGSLGFEFLGHNKAMYVGGNIVAGGSITPGSDKRLKKYIKNLPSDALKLINKLRPVSYTLREDSATALGFIADEVREVFPDLIIEGKDEDKMLSMNYMGLTAPIVKAIQEMHTSHVELQNKYNNLLARVEALEGK